MALIELGKRISKLQLSVSFHLEEKKYPNLVHSSHLVPPKREENNSEILSKFTEKRYRLTKRLRPNHRTIEHFPTSQYFTTTLLTDYLQQVLFPSTSCPAIQKILHVIPKG